jgi:para-nitrobenzyl esterase
MSALLSKCLAKSRRRLPGTRRIGSLYGALALSIVATAFVPADATAAEGPTVTTRYGQVQGKAGQTANSYLGIPYAAPPVGSQRWKPPSPPERRQGVRDATTPGNPCMQAVRSSPWGTSRDPARPARTACT